MGYWLVVELMKIKEREDNAGMSRGSRSSKLLENIVPPRVSATNDGEAARVSRTSLRTMRLG
jgi:hypothetical protein